MERKVKNIKMQEKGTNSLRSKDCNEWLYLVSSVSWRATLRTVMFLRTKRRVVVGYGLSEELKLTSVRCKEMTLYSLEWWWHYRRKISMKDVLRKWDVCKRSGHHSTHKNKNYRKWMEEWKGVFRSTEPIMSREKTEEMWV